MPADAGGDATADGRVPSREPQIPWLADDVPAIAAPTLTPCPEGFREVTDGELVTCDPYPEGGAAACGPGEAHFVGEPGCTPVGAPCPAGDFAEGLPAEGVIYVSAGAVGGDGSRAAPFGSFNEVTWSSIGAGETVALARGTYEGIVALKAGVRVVGACAAETILTGLEGPVLSAVTVTSAGEAATLENVTIRNPPQHGCYVDGVGRALHLEGVIIDGARTLGAAVVEGTLTAHELVVRNVWWGGVARSAAVFANEGATLTIDRGIVSDNEQEGAAAIRMATLTLTDTVVRDNGAWGIVARESGEVSATRVVLERNGDVNAMSFVQGSITLTDSIVRDGVAGANGDPGLGVVASDTGRVELRRTVLERNRGTSLIAQADSSATLSDVVLRDTQQDAAGRFGRALAANPGSRIEGSRVVVLRSPAEGLFAGGEGGVVALSDVVVRDMSATTSGGYGSRGVGVETGGRVELTRALLERNEEFGVYVSDAGSTAILTDVRIRDTVPRRSDQKFGIGVNAQLDARLEATRVVATGQSDMGFLASAGTTVALSDVIVRDTRALEATGEFGHGVQLQYDVVASLARVRIESTRGAGLLAYDGSEVTVAGLTVRDVGPWRCSDATCPEAVYGYAVSAIGSTVSVSDFALADAEVCGLFIANDGALDAEMGEVRGSSIGACIQVDGYDISRLQRSVTYVDNGTNLDTTSLPIPEPHVSGGG